MGGGLYFILFYFISTLLCDGLAEVLSFPFFLLFLHLVASFKYEYNLSLAFGYDIDSL
ncbi:hypothetical protein BDV40DRAFT_278825 [Aspergillus tamarii]|uniref:Uncharacterized protein n=1 Tax=Aspergillus tamarii TaxID=41984 RepID=A0A5N6UF41_ASPTM|nr:hypothetical protein BDV40DRAFT_278825 [Aspergillus tamarii]